MNGKRGAATQGANKIYDADAHVMMSPRMWEDLPTEYNARRPRPLRIADMPGAGIRNTGWLIESRMGTAPLRPRLPGGQYAVIGHGRVRRCSGSRWLGGSIGT